MEVIDRIRLFSAFSVIALLSTLSRAEVTTTHSDRGVGGADFTFVSESHAKRWGLDDDEYQRYLHVIQGPLGRWNPNIDPVMALGMFAESEAERERYAERYAQQEYELVMRTQAFERSYREAFNRLYPHAQVIASEHMAGYYAHQSQKRGRNSIPEFLRAVQKGDRLLYFPEVDCSGCAKNVAHLREVLSRNEALSVDVYIRGADGADAARRWARNNKVDITLVRQGRFTINVDEGTYTQLKAQSGQATPYYLSRGEHIFAVKPSDVVQL